MATSRREILKLGLLGLASLAGNSESASAQSRNRFVFANSSAFDSLDPHTVFDQGRAAVRFNLYDGLLRFVDNPPKLIPWLAESYAVSDDGKTYTFKLRADATFHDGTPVTSADVAYSIERILALRKGPASFYLDLIEPGSTQTPDPHTVVFNLTDPSAIFLTTVPNILVVNSALVRSKEKDGDWGAGWLARNEAGTGSYILRRYEPAVGWSGQRFTNHFAGWAGQPIDEIEFRTVQETNTRVLGLMRGDFDGADGLTYEQIQRLRPSPNVQILEAESMRIFLLALNNSKPLMNDVHFRRALAYSFDYDGFIKNIMKDSVTRNPGPNPVTIWGSPPGLKGYSFDLAKAREELAQVKQPLRKISINALAGYSESEQAAVLFQSALRQIGIEADIDVTPWPVVASRFAKAETQADVTPVWRSTFYVDPNNWVGEGFGTRYHGTRTMSYYSNPAFDQLLDQALLTNDHERRRELYEQMSQIVSDDAAGIFIYNTRWFGPYSTRVSGIRFSPASNGNDIRWATMTR
ncbi:ABC transporter substrate-binding protein [Ancylobacter sonchi]|uniref:ABC transporter substrate-binding protein n=1 Tax=Ancylobacter sonchi TaxID=1937790 RepID=UPI001BD4964F|nr:ABC transporter substrate-binding protein [Ancylobacter sonchi]MBS7532433.1 ABC transporter substrate-binding protein [Ancylobacter sonchi]